MEASRPIPTPDSQTGLRALQAMLGERHPLAALQVFHDELGDVFRIQLPGFTPVVLVGPQAARFVLVEERGELLWRNEADPVVALLRHGLLVEDGQAHDDLRRLMNPALHRRMLERYLAEMIQAVDQVTSHWHDGDVVDMLVEMRKIALLILVGTLFGADFQPELQPLWQPILDSIRFISPGIWMVWHDAPRPQYRSGLQRLDDYLYRLIRERRALGDFRDAPDLLGTLIASGMTDDLIRDQLLTMLIAGHDTSTALLSWALFLLGSHPQAYQRAQDEVDAFNFSGQVTIEQLSGLRYLDSVIREALRLYPPIHLGSRLAATDLDYQGYRIPAGERVIYSIYLTQRHRGHWQDPHRFLPERHASGGQKTPYTWLAFGGGPRNCIGAAFGQVEAKLVLATVLRRFDLQLVERHVRPHMGATLEPHPGVRMRLKLRTPSQ